MRIRWWLLLLLCAVPTWSTFAQKASECTQLVQTALEATQDACTSVEADKACFGYANVSASAYPQITDFQFESVGDVEDIADIASLETSAASVFRRQWGITRMDIEAIIPDTSERDTVTLLMYGDVAITNSFEPSSLMGTVSASLNVNVRTTPSTSSFVTGSIASGTTIGIIGRNSDGSWLRFRSEEIEGWLSRDFIIVDGTPETAVAALPDLTRRGIFYGPMQAFFMQSGDNPSSCSVVPQNGIIIQTHNRDRLVNLLINEVSIDFNSTIHLQTKTHSGLTSLIVTTLEGETQVMSQFMTETALSGQAISIDLDENNAAVSVPSEPVPLDAEAVDNLPTTLLPRNICVPHPYESPPDATASLETNLTGVNLDELEPLGKPKSELLGNLGWVRLPYNVSNGVGSVDIQAAYDRYQPLLEQYVQDGYNTILVLTHQTYGELQDKLPDWSEMTDEDWRQLSDELAVVTCHIAKQYVGQGIATVYQIWNEQDAPSGARASIGMSVDNYAYMVARVSQAIRAADPNALIITGGYTRGPGLGAEYARQMVRLLPRPGLIDGIAFHPYGRGVEFDSPYRVFGHIDVSIQAYSNVLRGKPVWMTEWGVLDRPLDSSSDIAEYALSMVNYVNKWYPDRVAAMVWYAWVEDMDNGYSLVDSDERPRPQLYEEFTTYLADRVQSDTDYRTRLVET